MEVRTNMNQYVTGAVIRTLREKNKMTQLQLAEKLGVTDKTVSKWGKMREAFPGHYPAGTYCEGVQNFGNRADIREYYS